MGGLKLSVRCLPPATVLRALSTKISNPQLDQRAADQTPHPVTLKIGSIDITGNE